jgi:hypothetical protein
VDGDFWNGLFGATTLTVLLVGYTLGGVRGMLIAGGGFFALIVLGLVVGSLIVFTESIREEGGDPVVVYSVLVIAAAVVALTIDGDWPLALGLGLGLPLGYWYWKRPTS